jgi:all-trans-retinol 13,14-reductase
MKKIIISHIALLYSLITLFTGCDFLSKKVVDTGAQHNWVVASNPLKVKQPNEFDVIIVGSGIGGLSCGSILAKKGYKVLVLEQHSQVGGYCSSYVRDGFTCSVGVEDVSGVNEPGMISRLLKTLELNKDDLFVLHTRTYFIDDKKIILSGTKENFIEQIAKCYPLEEQTLKLFVGQAQQAYEEYASSREKSPKLQPTFFKWKSVTYQQKLDEFFKDADLKNLLSSLLGYIGGNANEMPASTALFGCLQYFIYGGHYPKGGPQYFANTLKDVIEKNGGRVLTSCKIDQVLVKNNQVSGVYTGTQAYFSPIVVANVNAKTLFSQLVPKGAIDQSFIDAISQLKMSKSVIAVTLGVDMDLSFLTSKVDVLDLDSKYSFVVSSNADPSLAPRGMATISFSTNASYKETPQEGTQEYTKYKEEKAQKCIARIEKIIPELSKHIIFKDILTPRSFERFTSMPEGAIYSFDQSIGNKRPYFKTPLKGLYLASASTGFGGGVEAVVASGFICARDILEAQG